MTDNDFRNDMEQKHESRERGTAGYHDRGRTMIDRQYIIGHGDKIHLIGVDGEPWKITLKEAKEHKRQLERMIERREELIDNE